MTMACQSDASSPAPALPLMVHTVFVRTHKTTHYGTAAATATAAVLSSRRQTKRAHTTASSARMSGVCVCVGANGSVLRFNMRHQQIVVATIAYPEPCAPAKRQI